MERSVKFEKDTNLFEELSKQELLIFIPEDNSELINFLPQEFKAYRNNSIDDSIIYIVSTKDKPIKICFEGTNTYGEND